MHGRKKTLCRLLVVFCFEPHSSSHLLDWSARRREKRRAWKGYSALPFDSFLAISFSSSFHHSLACFRILLLFSCCSHAYTVWLLLLLAEDRQSVLDYLVLLSLFWRPFFCLCGRDLSLSRIEIKQSCVVAFLSYKWNASFDTGSLTFHLSRCLSLSLLTRRCFLRVRCHKVSFPLP